MMTKPSSRRSLPPWWQTWRPGRRAEALVIALIILGLTLLTLTAAYHAYQAGLAAVGQAGRPAAWLVRAGEASLLLVLGVAGGGWLAGVWLGERLARQWLLSGLVAALAAGAIALWLAETLAVAVPGGSPLLAAIAVIALLLGGVVGAWWSGLGGASIPPD